MFSLLKNKAKRQREPVTRKRAVVLLLAVAAAGCTATVPDDTQVPGFEGVNDTAAFWIRMWEKFDDNNFAGTPAAFKQCAGSELVKMSPPYLNAAVERFVAEKNAGNYKALMPAINKFSSGYEEAYGIKPGARAGELCKDKLQA